MRALARGWTVLVTCPYTGARLSAAQIAGEIALTLCGMCAGPIFVILVAVMFGAGS